MADDIVTRLQNYLCLGGYECVCDSCALHAEAADEIERLRAAGDALHEQAGKPCRCITAHDGAINERCAPCIAYFDWEDARRG